MSDRKISFNKQSSRVNVDDVAMVCKKIKRWDKILSPMENNGQSSEEQEVEKL